MIFKSVCEIRFGPTTDADLHMHKCKSISMRIHAGYWSHVQYVPYQRDITPKSLSAQDHQSSGTHVRNYYVKGEYGRGGGGGGDMSKAKPRDL